jgi:hypothetical protein
MRFGSSIAWLLLLASSAGCSVFPSAADQLALHSQPNPGGATAAGLEKKVTLEVRPQNGAPRTVQVPLDEISHAQSAYERSRGLKKFRRSEVEIYRPTARGDRLRLTSKVDPKTKRVTNETDYAIHPGDYVVVNEVPFNIWDEMTEHAVGPLRFLGR